MIIIAVFGGSMLEKAIGTIKSTLILCVCILLPIFIGMCFVKSSIINDSEKCIDSFIQDEGIGLAKYVGLQLENSRISIDSICSKINDISDTEKAKEVISELVKNDENLEYITLYNNEGKIITSSIEENVDEIEDLDLESTRVKNTEDGISYALEQLENETIVVKYLLKKEINGKTVYPEIAIKWNQYEKYMNGLQQGSFPRSFYIVSPDCRRYISFNSLPASSTSKKDAAALGMHLVSKLKSIKNGISDVKVQSYTFKVYKTPIKINKQTKGAAFYIIVATDESTSEALSEDMQTQVPRVFFVLAALILIFLIIFARFYNKTKEELEIATKIRESTPLSIVIFKASDGKVMQINLSAMTLFKIEKEKIPTVNFWDIFMYDDDREYISSAADSNINVLNYEVLAQSFGGSSFWGVISASPIDVDGNKYIVLAALDINRRKEVEKKLANNAALLEKQIAERTQDLEIKAKELAESNSLLEKAKSVADEASKAKSRFLASMSNELKTPINAIIGYAEILEEEAEDRKDTVSADDLKKIIGSAKHLLSLIDQILDLSKIEAGKTQFFFENVEIKDILKDVEGVAMPLVTKNDNSLFIEFNKEIGSMYTDTTKLRQCLLNLLSNAAKFTQFGKITLHVGGMVKAGTDFIEFSVTDTGCGIERERLETIFDTFYDDNSESLSTNSGSGLGLSLTKKYTEYMGGTISVESEIGVGSKFIIRIPRVAKVESNEFIEVKNRNAEDDRLAEQLMEEMEEITEEISDETPTSEENPSSEEPISFGRKSDL